MTEPFSNWSFAVEPSTNTSTFHPRTIGNYVRPTPTEPISTATFATSSGALFSTRQRGPQPSTFPRLSARRKPLRFRTNPNFGLHFAAVTAKSIGPHGPQADDSNRATCVGGGTPPNQKRRLSPLQTVRFLLAPHPQKTLPHKVSDIGFSTCPTNPRRGLLAKTDAVGDADAVEEVTDDVESSQSLQALLNLVDSF